MTLGINVDGKNGSFTNSEGNITALSINKLERILHVQHVLYRVIDVASHTQTHRQRAGESN